jgi:hypothetical protein
MRRGLIALSLLLCSITPALAQLSINFGGPGVNIGIDLGGYPTLQRIPGYPVYYAPGVNSNYFFYDGLYWDFDGNNWYASSWYNGPWTLVDPMDVPVFILRVPVRYYRHAPSYFRSWRSDDAPQWGQHWGSSWEQRHSGWNTWNRGSAPAPAPLPTYQKQYSGSRYPQAQQQAVIETQNYRYQPHDAVAQRNFEQRRTQAQAAPQQQQQQRQQPQQQQQQRQQPQQQQQQQQPQRTQQEVRQRPQDQQAAPAPQRPLATRATQQAPSPERAAQPQQQNQLERRPQQAPRDQPAPVPQRAQQAPRPEAQPAPRPEAQRPQQAPRQEPAREAPRPQQQGPQGRPQEPARDNKGGEKGGGDKEKGPEQNR